MAYTVRKAEQTDLPRILEIYASARHFMAQTGNPNQWGTTHPPRQQLEQDIRQGDLLVVEDNQGIHGVFFFSLGEDPTYGQIYDGQWHAQRPYGTIHRIASDGSGGILGTAVAYGKARSDYLRIDTHEDNKSMQRFLQKYGFSYCGIIYLENKETRLAFEKIIS